MMELSLRSSIRSLATRLPPGLMALMCCSTGCTPSEPVIPGGAVVLDVHEQEHSHVIAFSPDSRYFARGDHDGVLKIFDMMHGARATSLTRHRGAISGIAFNCTSDGIVSGSELIGRGYGGDLCFDRVNGQRLVVTDAQHRNGAGWVGFSEACDQVISIPIPGTEIRFLDPHNLELAKTTTLPLAGRGESVHRASIAQDGETLAVLTTEGRLIIWNTRSNCAAKELAGNDCLALSNDGSAVATMPSRGTGKRAGPIEVQVLSTASGELICRCMGSEGAIADLQFSADGHFLISGGATSDWLEGELNVWELRSGALVRRLQPFNEPIASVAVSPDGALIAVSGGKRRLVIWRAQEVLHGGAKL